MKVKELRERLDECDADDDVEIEVKAGMYRTIRVHVADIHPRSGKVTFYTY